MGSPRITLTKDAISTISAEIDRDAFIKLAGPIMTYNNEGLFYAGAAARSASNATANQSPPFGSSPIGSA